MVFLLYNYMKKKVHQFHLPPKPSKKARYSEMYFLYLAQAKSQCGLDGEDAEKYAQEKLKEMALFEKKIRDAPDFDDIGDLFKESGLSYIENDDDVVLNPFDSVLKEYRRETS